MSLESQLQDLARGLREENVPNFFIQDLYQLAEEVGDLEWHLEGLEK